MGHQVSRFIYHPRRALTVKIQEAINTVFYLIQGRRQGGGHTGHVPSTPPVSFEGALGRQSTGVIKDLQAVPENSCET